MLNIHKEINDANAHNSVFAFRFTHPNTFGASQTHKN